MEKEEKFSEELGNFAIEKAKELGLSAAEMLENISHTFLILTCAMLKDGVDGNDGIASAIDMFSQSVYIMERAAQE